MVGAIVSDGPELPHYARESSAMVPGGSGSTRAWVIRSRRSPTHIWRSCASDGARRDRGGSRIRSSGRDQVRAVPAGVGHGQGGGRGRADGLPRPDSAGHAGRGHGVPAEAPWRTRRCARPWTGSGARWASRAGTLVEEAPGGQTLCVFSAKGGSGSTTFAVNLAVEVHRLTRKKTLLVDLDLELGETASSWGCSPSSR
jgi:hypothetical protein